MIYRLNLPRELTSSEVDANFGELFAVATTFSEEMGSDTYTPGARTTESVSTYEVDQDTLILPPKVVIAGKHGLIIIKQNPKGNKKVKFSPEYEVTDPDNIIDMSPNGVTVLNFKAVKKDKIVVDLVYSGSDPEDIIYWDYVEADQDISYSTVNIVSIFGQEVAPTEPIWDQSLRYQSSNITVIFGQEVAPALIWDQSLRYQSSNITVIFGQEVAPALIWDQSLRYQSSNIVSIFGQD